MILYRLKSLKFLFVIIYTFPLISYSQSELLNEVRDSTTNYIEVSAYGASASNTPFWLQANQYGIVPKTSPTGSLRGQLEKIGRINSSGTLRIGAGVELVSNFNKDNNKLLLPQAYGTLRFKNWELFVGRKKQVIGLADSTISSGSYSWSQNALPIPKISIGTMGFVNVPFTKGWISFNGFYSDGFFENSRPVTSELKLHQKQLYIRLGKVSSRVKLYGGFNHQVQWGGKSEHNTEEGVMPRGFSNYINVITGKAHSKNPGINDATGRVGNHLGSIDLGMEIETYSTSILFYRQSLYEDGSLFWLANIEDGLNGFRMKFKNSYGGNFEITSMVLEFLYTKDQGGDTADWGQPSWARGKDDYFNNGQVRDGWSYYGRTIGTPFIPPTSDTVWNYPQYADFMTSNNRVAVFHLGLQGTLFQKIGWISKLSYSSNSGTYDAPIYPHANQFSGLLAFQSHLNFLGGATLKGSLAADIGKLYPTTYGFSLGLRKDFSF
ncbi:hypothetical protein DSL64_09575 [Dyadobacter luteus]|uniref:Capsule assembly Wzi family protein n=1 Tax=Dyadobacter luteus TaxID=2259619 RepID=A0A3D8YE51_9BACT|nr:capsule assembly Wzi family protein [Dyadobacter luteus]REA62488.1 hypothetical protein DSL64_09575 [Dyadobacter luteus]